MEENPFLDLVPEQNRQSYLTSMAAPDSSTPQKNIVSPPMQAPDNQMSMESWDGEANPFADLIPKQPPTPAKSGGDKIMDYMQYLNDSVAKGAKQALLAPAQYVNPFIDKVAGTRLTESTNKLGKDIDKEYREKYPDAGLIGQTLTNAAEILPGMFVGGGAVKTFTEGTKGLSYLGNLVKGGGAAGILSAPTIYDPSGELSPFEKTAYGAGAGAVLGPALGLAGKTGQLGKDLLGDTLGVAKKVLSPNKAAAEDLLGNIARRDETLSRKAAGERLGMNLTPAEASGSRLAAKSQAGLGYTKEGARSIEAMQDKRALQEKGMINSLLNDIAPEGGIGATQTRNAAQGAIKEKERALAEKAKPLYDEAYYVKNPPDGKAVLDPNNPGPEGKILRNITPDAMEDLKKDVLISDALKAVGKDKVFKKDLNGVPEHTVKYLDYTKKYLDDQIEVAQRQGEKNRVRLLMDSKNQLIDKVDELVPAYKEARQTFGPGAQAIQELRDSSVGKIARMDDDKLKTVASTIFDRRQTDPKVMAELRDEISAKDPMAWRKIMRNEMENRMAMTDTNEGSAFYKKVLKSNTDFNNFMEAAKGMPHIQQKLKDMREVLPYIFNKQSTKAAKGKAENFMDVMRNTYNAAIGAVKKHVAKEYDRAAIEMITTGKWDKELAKISKIKNPAAKRDRMGKIFENIISTGKGIGYARKNIVGASIPAVDKVIQQGVQEGQ